MKSVLESVVTTDDIAIGHKQLEQGGVVYLNQDPHATTSELYVALHQFLQLVPDSATYIERDQVRVLVPDERGKYDLARFLLGASQEITGCNSRYVVRSDDSVYLPTTTESTYVWEQIKNPVRRAS